MKAIQFTVPVSGEDIYSLLENKGTNFYNSYHRHNQLQLTYIVKGRGTIMIGNLIQSFHEHDVFILMPNEPHMFDKYGMHAEAAAEAPTDQVHAIHLFIDVQRMDRLFELPDFADIQAFFTAMGSSMRMDARYSSLWMPYFIKLTAATGLDRFVAFVSLLQEINDKKHNLVSIYSGLRTSPYGDHDGERISSVLKYTFESFDQPISVDDVAAIVHMSTTGFCKFFKKHTMKTYVSFLNEVRIEKACQLLLNREVESIAQVAFLVGFNNIVHFNRVFKQLMGQSPRDYVRQHRVA